MSRTTILTSLSARALGTRVGGLKQIHIYILNINKVKKAAMHKKCSSCSRSSSSSSSRNSNSSSSCRSSSSSRNSSSSSSSCTSSRCCSCRCSSILLITAVVPYADGDLVRLHNILWRILCEGKHIDSHGHTHTGVPHHGWLKTDLLHSGWRTPIHLRLDSSVATSSSKCGHTRCSSTSWSWL